MAQSRIAQLIFKLGADNKALLSKMNQTETRMKKFQGSIMKIGAAFGGLFAVGQITRFGKESLRAANVQLQAENTLLVALKGKQDIQRALIAQAQQLQGVTLFGDEETIQAQSLIAAFVREESQLKRIIPLVQDFATAKKMDLAGAADLVSKTLGSSTNAMSRYGIQVEGVVGSEERLLSLMDGLNDAFGGQAEAAAKVGTGSAIQLQNAFGDLSEEIGKMLIPALEGTSTALLSATQNATSFVAAMNKITQSDNLTFWEKLAGLMLGVNSAAGIALQGIADTDFKDPFGAKIASMNVEELNKELENLNTSLQASRAFQINGKSIIDAVDIEKNIKRVEDAIDGLTTKVESVSRLSPISKIMGQGFDETHLSRLLKVDKIGGMGIEIPELDASLADVGASLQRGFDYQKELISQNLIDIGGMVSQGLSDTIVNISEGFGQLVSGEIGFEDFFDKIIAGFANFLKQMGAMLIAYGTAKIALEVSGNPYIMVAAGAAMVAIGAAMGGLQSSSANFGGSSSGSGQATTANYAPQQNYLGQSEVTVTGVLRGEDIYLTNRKYSDKLGRF